MSVTEPGDDAHADRQPPPSSIEAAFRKGERQGKDPLNKVTADGPAVTGERSEWCGKYCERCLHNFRIDDPVDVRLGPDGRIAEVVHRLTRWCGGEDEGPLGDSTVAQAFFAGIDAENPPQVQHVRRLRADHSLVQPRREMLRKKDRRRQCFVCTQTFRPYEFVITCVCNPGQPECDLTVHRDQAHNLLCYEAFYRRPPRQCPTDLRTLGR